MRFEIIIWAVWTIPREMSWLIAFETSIFWITNAIISIFISIISFVQVFWDSISLPLVFIRPVRTIIRVVTLLIAFVAFYILSCNHTVLVAASSLVILSISSIHVVLIVVIRLIKAICLVKVISRTCVVAVIAPLLKINIC